MNPKEIIEAIKNAELSNNGIRSRMLNKKINEISGSCSVMTWGIGFQINEIKDFSIFNGIFGRIIIESYIDIKGKDLELIPQCILDYKFELDMWILNLEHYNNGGGLNNDFSVMIQIDEGYALEIITKLQEQGVRLYDVMTDSV